MLEPHDAASLGSEAIKRKKLAHMRGIATGCLIVAALLYAIATLHEAAWPWLGYVRAAAEAAMVGGLADWFAVSALFRHPLGLPLPHTAIIPANKDRIANNLGDFVQSEFFSTDHVSKVVKDFDLANHAAAWFSHLSNALMLAKGLRNILRQGLQFLDRTAVQDYLKKVIAEKFTDLDFSTLAGNILQVLTHENRHQALLGQALSEVDRLLNSDESKAILINATSEKIPGWVSLWISKIKKEEAEWIVEKFVDAVRELVGEVNKDSDHPLRMKFHDSIQSLIDKLKNDATTKEKIRSYQVELTQNKEFTKYVEGLLQDAHNWITVDLASDKSLIVDKTASTIISLGRELQSNTELRTAINTQIEENVPPLLEVARPKIAEFISSKMKAWKNEEIVEKLELHIGADLQFIRLNGTLIGGLVGLLIHALTTLIT